MNSYKEAANLGRTFIQETEAALLRVQALHMKKTLKPKKNLPQNIHHSPLNE